MLSVTLATARQSRSLPPNSWKWEDWPEPRDNSTQTHLKRTCSWHTTRCHNSLSTTYLVFLILETRTQLCTYQDTTAVDIVIVIPIQYACTKHNVSIGISKGNPLTYQYQYRPFTHFRLVQNAVDVKQIKLLYYYNIKSWIRTITNYLCTTNKTIHCTEQ